jgi:hypothetical protein
MALPFSSHWYVGDVPVATTFNVVVWPGLIVADAGCVVIAGGVITVTVAGLLVTDPAVFVTTTV